MVPERRAGPYGLWYWSLYHSQSSNRFRRRMTSSHVHFEMTSLTVMWKKDWKGSWVSKHGPVRRPQEKASQFGKWQEWKCWERVPPGGVSEIGWLRHSVGLDMWMRGLVHGPRIPDLTSQWTVLTFNRTGNSGGGSGLETPKDCMN